MKLAVTTNEPNPTFKHITPHAERIVRRRHNLYIPNVARTRENETNTGGVTAQKGEMEHVW